MRILSPQEFPFVGPSNLSFSPLIDAERSINLYYEPEYQGARAALIGTPGLSGVVATLAGVPANHGVRALFGYNNRLFAVGGAHFYEVGRDVGAGVIQDYGAMAGDDGNSVSIGATIRGGIATPMVMVCNPYSLQLYSVDFAGHTLTSRFNAQFMEYLDGFFVALATGASLAGTNPNQVNASAFNDGTTWPALAFILKEGSADAINGLATVNNLLWIFGKKNIEIWYNAGLPNFPFARVNGATLNVGCIAGQTIASVANSVMWVGASERGWGEVYLARGFQPERVSTFAVEQIIRAAYDAEVFSNAYAYEEAGHSFYVLNLVGFATLVYDLTTKLWHERAYWTGSALQTTDKPFCFASIGAFGARNFVGDNSTGNIYRLGLEFTNNNSVSIFRQRTATHLTDGEKWIKYPSFEVLADLGSVGPPTMTLLYSNDGGKTFPTLHRSDVSIQGTVPQNVFNSHRRYRWLQCGRARRRTFGIQVIDGNNPISIVGATLRVGEGTEP